MKQGRRFNNAALAGWSLAGAAFCLVFLALGIWQVERRSWKLDLIARVEARVHAAPVAAPARADWPAISATRDEYRHIQLTGRFRHDKESLAQASTVLGPGFWVLTPLCVEDGSCVLVNRGFVPPEKRDPASRADTAVQGPVNVAGLLRLSEPGGGFLRKNVPTERRWYSRDVAAIAAAQGIADAAPYFLDADADPQGGADAGRWPVGGLTVLNFRNSHAVYALTWFTLALMSAAAVVLLWRAERRGLPDSGVRETRNDPN
ncbi:SURF1 family protein [Niveibacterium sp. SC-1]|uniref:SURF1 family protein n=1 Tax=Niveibacterium sp. SC-1 TaxID=3135646 RepID=UPI00311DC506